MIIKRVQARKILNSKKEPTIEICVNEKYKASAPSGVSTGKYEVVDFPKKVPVNFVNKVLNKKLTGMEIRGFDDLKLIEAILEKYDRTKKWSKIGGNTVIALEFALLKMLSEGDIWSFLNEDAEKMPMPLSKCVGGGAHVKVRGKADIQEFLVLPKTTLFSDAAFVNSYVHRLVGKALNAKTKDCEGGWISTLSNFEILDVLEKVKKKVQKELGFKIYIGLDMAASQFWERNRYHYKNFSDVKKEKKLSKKEQLDFVLSLIKDYNLAYVEDAFDEDDFDSFARLRKGVKGRAFICGDDLICTNLERLKKAVNAVNAVIIKPNQIGSLIKTKEVVDFAKKNKIVPVISHRGGETVDATIAHLAVAWEIPIIKCGIAGKERLAKINELIKIEKELRD